jgi:hypothetical protein
VATGSRKAAPVHSLREAYAGAVQEHPRALENRRAVHESMPEKYWRAEPEPQATPEPKPLKGPMFRALRRKKNRSLCWTPLSVPQRTRPRALHSSFRPTAGLAASPSIRPTCAPRFSRVLAMNSLGRFRKRRLRNAVVQRFEAARSKPACATAILKRVNGHKEPPEARKMRARTDTPSYSRSRRCTVARFTRG